jgi:hypothetical protein
VAGARKPGGGVESGEDGGGRDRANPNAGHLR